MADNDTIENAIHGARIAEIPHGMRHQAAIPQKPVIAVFAASLSFYL